LLRNSTPLHKTLPGWVGPLNIPLKDIRKVDIFAPNV